jgi:hypothetical protein
MKAIAELARPGALGVDTVARITPTMARAIRADGREFVVRYVPFAGGGVCRWDVTTTELQLVLRSGLRLLLVQRVRTAGAWHPSPDLGRRDGQQAAQHAIAVGYPLGATIYCDLEGVAEDAAANDTLAHVNAWSDAVQVRGFQPGLYVGAGCGLTAQQLFRGLKLRTYWDSCSRNPEPLPRGWSMLQTHGNVRRYGILVDLDTIQADHLGGLPTWARAAT